LNLGTRIVRRVSARRVDVGMSRGPRNGAKLALPKALAELALQATQSFLRPLLLFAVAEPSCRAEATG
jgi:hypothetical protein